MHVAFVHEGRHLQKLVDGGISIHRLPTRGNHDVGIAFRLQAIIGRIQPGIVQTWLPQMDVFGGIAAKARGRKWVLSERSTGAAYRHRLKDRILRARVGIFADAIVANSPGGIAYWADRVRKGMLLTIVPNALSLDAIAQAPPISIDEEGIHAGFILYVGRFSGEKNLPVLLRAMALINAKRNVRALLCGDGPMLADLLVLIDQLGLQQVVTVTGVREDVWGLMKSAGAIVSPSLFEGQPNVVLEAAAAGCPLILSDITGHRDVAPEGAAVFFKPGSAEELAWAIQQTLDDPVRTANRRDTAKCHSRQFSIDRAVRGYQDVYDRLLRDG